MRKNNKKHLPIFSIGPIYVIILLILTLGFSYLNYKKYINNFKIISWTVLLDVSGVSLIILGIIIWFFAVVVAKIDKEIKNNKLVVNGVYRYVRNPIYSAFLYVFSGILFLNHNFILLGLPILYWAFLTILLKKTEEKWLYEKYGNGYLEYCRHTNRCIIFFQRKKN